MWHFSKRIDTFSWKKVFHNFLKVIKVYLNLYNNNINNKSFNMIASKEAITFLKHSYVQTETTLQ